jgi:hypothetical protein
LRQLFKLVIFVGSIEALVVNLFSSTPVVEPLLAALLLAAPETNPVFRCAALRFDTPALLSILIEVDDLHRLLPLGDLHGSVGYNIFISKPNDFAGSPTGCYACPTGQTFDVSGEITATGNKPIDGLQSPG